MGDAATGLAGASAGLQIGTTALDFFAKRDAADEENDARRSYESAGRKAAMAAFREDVSTLALADDQDAQGTADHRLALQKAAARARSRARVAASEAGVGGQSVQHLLRDFTRQEVEAIAALEGNRVNRGRERLRHARRLSTTTDARLTGLQQGRVPLPSYLAGSLLIGGSALNAAADIKRTTR